MRFSYNHVYLLQSCPSGFFTCFSGFITCVDETFRCDCTRDCTDGSDENTLWAGCAVPCDNAASGIGRWNSDCYICLLTTRKCTWLLW